MTTIEKVRLVLGEAILAGVLYALAAALGFLSDLASTVPVYREQQASARRLVYGERP